MRIVHPEIEHDEVPCLVYVGLIGGAETTRRFRSSYTAGRSTPDFAAMRVRHEWQRFPIAAILLILLAAVAAPRWLRYRVQNAGSRTRTVRSLRLDDLRPNITLGLNDLAIGGSGCEQPDSSPAFRLLPLRGEEELHRVAVAGMERVWLPERRAPAHKPCSATSGRAPPLLADPFLD
jgi:hypothetical protein